MNDNTRTPVSVEIGCDRNGDPASMDFFGVAGQEVGNTIIFGSPDTGKTPLPRTLAQGLVQNGVRTVVLVTERGGKYKSICKKAGGKYLDFTPDCGLCINPLAMTKRFAAENRDPVAEKFLQLHTVLSFLDPEICGASMYEIQCAVKEVYNRSGLFRDDVPVPEAWSPGNCAEMPTLQDVYSALIQQFISQPGDSSGRYPFASMLCTVMSPMVNGSKVFVGQTNIELDSAFTVIDVSAMTEEAAAFIAFNYICETVADSPAPQTAIIIDNYANVIGSRVPEAASGFVGRAYANAHTYGMAFITTVPNPTSFFRGCNGQVILENCRHVALFPEAWKDYEDLTPVTRLFSPSYMALNKFIGYKLQELLSLSAGEVMLCDLQDTSTRYIRFVPPATALVRD